ncbi:MAG: putative glycolipid-binding domain-containing protein [Acidimicrobiia bacterium]|nr:putative glycolipid-binding domain-containing protein [Acidimicrobiia bacterium]
MGPVTSIEAFSAGGHVAHWRTGDGAHRETLSLRWENEAWTATAELARERVQYVLRLAPTWRIRQFLLFRDSGEPDLWLATDGHDRWGEVNGAHRTELDGCTDIDIVCSVFPATVPIRRLPLGIGDAAELRVAVVDVESLAVDVAVRRYTRVGERTWRRWSGEDGKTTEFDVDAHGLVIDQPDRPPR